MLNEAIASQIRHHHLMGGVLNAFGYTNACSIKDKTASCHHAVMRCLLS